MTIVQRIADAVIKGNISEVEDLTRKALEEGEDVIKKILQEGYAAGLKVVGEKFSIGEIFMPEMLVAGEAVKSGTRLLRPFLAEWDTQLVGIVVAGTVVGDSHDIGKDLVCMMLEGAGFKVINLGTNIPAEGFIEAARTNSADIIAMSALLTTTRMAMEGIIQEIRTSELNQRVKVMVGGAPVTQGFAERIGADGYAPDAALAVKKAKELLRVG